MENDPVDEAHGYEVWRSSDPDDYSSWVRIAVIEDGLADSCTDSEMEEAGTYYYVVRAFHIGADGKKVSSDYSDMSAVTGS